MGIHNGKFFDVAKTAAYFGDLADAYGQYKEKALLHQSAIGDFVNTEAWKGNDAEVAKRLMKANKIPLVDDILGIQDDTKSLCNAILEKFKFEVDDAPDGRIDYDSLERLNNDYKNIYYNFVAIDDEVRRIAENGQRNYGRYGQIDIPDTQPCRDAFVPLCGGDDDAGGFIFECMQKLTNFDFEVSGMIEEKDFSNRIDIILGKMGVATAKCALPSFNKLQKGNTVYSLINFFLSKKIIKSAVVKKTTKVSIKERYGSTPVGKVRTLNLSGTKGKKNKVNKSKGKKTNGTAGREAYYTNDAAMNREIDRIFDEYGNDLEGLNLPANQMVTWDGLGGNDNITKKAMGHIFDVACSDLDNHFSNKAAANSQAIVGNVLRLMLNNPDKPGSEKTIFNFANVADFSNYISNDTAEAIVGKLSKLKMRDDCRPYLDYKRVNVKYVGPGIDFSITNMDGSSESDVLVYQTDSRTRRYIAKTEENTPGCFDFEYSLLDCKDKVGALSKLYSKAKSADDVRFIDKLFKAGGSYEGLFDINPDSLSENVQLIVGQHMVGLADDRFNATGYKQYKSLVNAALNSHLDNRTMCDSNIEFLSVASSLAADIFRTSAWAVNLDDAAACEKLSNQIRIASKNELAMYSLYEMLDSASCADSFKSLELADNFSFSDESDGIMKLYYDRAIIDASNTTGYGVKPATIAHGQCYTITLNLERGVDGLASKITGRIAEVQKEKQAAEEQLLLDASISIIGCFFPAVEEGWDSLSEMIDTIESGDYIGSATDRAASSVLEKSEIATSLYGLIKAFDDAMNDQAEKMEDIEDDVNALTFYEKFSYGCGADSGTYSKMSFEAIKLIREWDEQGIAVLYGGNQDIANKYLDVVMCSDEGTISQTIVDEINGYCGYSDKEIEKAVKTVVCGAGKEDTYKSVNDIPYDLLCSCLTELNGKVGDSVIFTNINNLTH